MLRKRSRAVSSKQGLMTDPLSLPSPTGKYSRPTASSLLTSPNLFVGFPVKLSDCEAVMSPTSILETKPFSSSIGNPFFYDRNTRKPLIEDNKHHPWDNGDSGAVGLGIVDALLDDKPDAETCKADSRMVLFGSQLKIQIPSIHPNSTWSIESPSPRVEFGIKNKNPLLSPIGTSSMGPADMPLHSPGVFAGCLSASEMEMSEDYTCVISHGPNPRTTHIFDNCIVESHSDALSPLGKGSRTLTDRPVYPSDDFLTICYACKKDLGQGRDIFMYRGEKAFCSSECRYQEMMFDEVMEKDASAIL